MINRQDSSNKTTLTMKNIFYTLFILTISTQLVNSQNLNRANHLFENRAYMDAAEIYSNESPKTQEIYQN